MPTDNSATDPSQPDTRADGATSAHPPSGPNQLWQLGFVDVAGADGATWRITGIADCWSRYEFMWRIAPARERGSADAALAMAILEAEHLAGKPLAKQLRIDPLTGEPITIKVFISHGWRLSGRHFARYVESFPEFALIREWPALKEIAQDHPRGFETMCHEWLLRAAPADGDELENIARWYRIQFNTDRPHPELGGAPPALVHLQATVNTPRHTSR